MLTSRYVFAGTADALPVLPDDPSLREVLDGEFVPEPDVLGDVDAPLLVADSDDDGLAGLDLPDRGRDVVRWIDDL